MNKFLTFETNALRINNSIFPCEKVSFDLKADVSNVYDIDGNFLYYSPNGPIQGQIITQFYLTGSLPSYLRAETQTENPVKVKFNNFYIPSAYLTDFGFTVEPYSPILASATFLFFHGLSVLDVNQSDQHSQFDATLTSLDGLSSYLVTTSRENYAENPNNFVVTNFSYSFSVDRQPVLRVKEIVPSRVALKQVNLECNVGTNNLDGKLKINGNKATFSAYLNDSRNNSVSSQLNITGIIVDQSYDIGADSVGSSKVKLIQTINSRRDIVTIPFEEEDNSLVYRYKEEYAEIPVIDDPVYPPPPNPPIIVNGNIVGEKTYQFTVLFRFPFTSINGSTSTQPCNDEKGYADPLMSVSSFDVNGYRFNFSPKDSSTKYSIQPSYDETATLTEYEKHYRPPNYYVATFSCNQAFLDYINNNISLAETFPTITASDDYGNETQSVFYIFSNGYINNEGVCEIQPRTLHYVTWDQLFSKMSSAIADPNYGNGGSLPYIIKFGFGA